jgi:hypothetical protein
VNNAAAIIGFVGAILAGLWYQGRPPEAYRPNPNKGWWTRENTAKSDAALPGCVFFAVAIWVALGIASLLVMKGVAAVVHQF